MLFLYGSQTGNAQDVAQLLASEAMARGIDCCALPMDCVAVEEMAHETAIVFVCSTTGAPTSASLPPGPVECRRKRYNSATATPPTSIWHRQHQARVYVMLQAKVTFPRE